MNELPTTRELQAAIKKIFNPFESDKSRSLLIRLRTKGAPDADYYRGQLDILDELRRHLASHPTEEDPHANLR